MSENETSLQLDTRREKLQKIHKSTIDLTNLGALKNEETKPTISPSQPPQTPDPATTCDDSPTADKKTEIAGISD